MSDPHALSSDILQEAFATLPANERSDRIHAFFARPDVALSWISGYCPVQAEGQFQGVAFTFRARGQRWKLEMDGPAPWSFEAAYGSGPFDAGWMELGEALGFIMDALELSRIAQDTPAAAAA